VLGPNDLQLAFDWRHTYVLGLKSWDLDSLSKTNALRWHIHDIHEDVQLHFGVLQKSSRTWRHVGKANIRVQEFHTVAIATLDIRE